MEYKFKNVQKKFQNAKSFTKTKDILKKCNFATLSKKVLTPQQQSDLGICLTKDGFFNMETSMLALPFLYEAANNGIPEAQLEMYLYLHEDKHKDAIVYLKMAIENGYEPAKWAFFRNYIQKRKAYIAEPEIFKTILKEYEKTKDDDKRLYAGLYYEKTEHDYKKAIKYYKNTLFQSEIERLKLILYEQEHPSKALREDILKKYPKIYKMNGNKLEYKKK